MSVTGHPLYPCLDGIVVGACRAASAAGLPADPAEEKRSIFLPPYSVYRFYTMTSTGPGRAVAIVYYMFLLISFTVFFYWIGFVLLKMQARPNPPERIEVSGKLNTSRYLAMAVLLFSILCTGLWQETSAMKAIRVLTDGEAAAYAAEYEDRLLLLNDPEVTDVVLTPFTHQPALIYTGDLPGDPEDPTSRKVAQYFQKTSLYVNYGNN